MLSTVDAAVAIEADGVVFHVGSHLGAGFEAGLERCVPALEQVLERTSETTWLLLENSAGAGGTIGRSVDEVAQLVDALGRHPRLGVCLDSCHLYVSGVDVGDREDGRRDARRARPASRAGPAAGAARERRRRAARLEPRPARERARGRARRAARRVPRASRGARPGGRDGDPLARRAAAPTPPRWKSCASCTGAGGATRRAADAAAALTGACVFQHKPLFRPRALERVERDRQVDDPARAEREGRSRTRHEQRSERRVAGARRGRGRARRGSRAGATPSSQAASPTARQVAATGTSSRSSATTRAWMRGSFRGSANRMP